MRVIGAQEIDAALDFGSLIDALAEAFAADVEVPVRHHHEIALPGRATATALLMPAWTRGASPNYLGTKLVNVFPDNVERGLPSVSGVYVLMSGDTGQLLSVMDGARLTLWRTAAASALASRFLSAPAAEHMLMIGAGALAPFLVRAHASVRPLCQVTLWNRSPGRAEAVADALADTGLRISVATNLPEALAVADIVSTATMSSTPLVTGLALKAGAHLDLVGAFRPTMREADDDAIRRSRIFVDTRAGAMKEAGDIAVPLASGVLLAERIEADLFDLCRGHAMPQRLSSDITLFKSVGTAIEDLAAATLVHQTVERTVL
jgi:ornithine cyclodeaminase